MTVSVDYEKSDGFSGTFDIEGAFDSTMEEEAASWERFRKMVMSLRSRTTMAM